MKEWKEEVEKEHSIFRERNKIRKKKTGKQTDRQTKNYKKNKRTEWGR